MRNFLKWFLNSVVSLVFWCPVILGASVVAGASFEEAYFHMLVPGSADQDGMGPLIGYALLSLFSAAVAFFAAWQVASAFIVGAGLLTVPKSSVRIRILWKSQLRFRWSPSRT